MEDLAQFIQSMSEKYGLLDASHKQYQPGANSTTINKLDDQQLLLQDQPSSAASNTLNGEECPGSSWECLSIFMGGSQAADCKNSPPAPNHALPALAYPKMPPALQRQGANNTTSSPTLHSFSNLIDIDEHECPSIYNFGKGSFDQQQQQELTGIGLTSQLGASTVASTDLVERGNLFESCGVRSSVVTMPDYIQQCCSYPGVNNHVDGPQSQDTNFCPTAFSPTKNSGHSQQLQQPTKNDTAAATNCAINSTLAQQGVKAIKMSEGNGEMLLSNSRSLLGQEDRNSIELRSDIDFVAASTLGQGQQMQRTSSRSRLGLSSTSEGLNYTEADLGEADMVALHEFSRGRRARGAHLGTDTYCRGHEEAYQHGLPQHGLNEGTKGMLKTNSEGRTSSRDQAVASDDQFLNGFPSFNYPGEHQERGKKATSGCSCSSTETLPLPVQNGHHHQQGKRGTAVSCSSSSSLDYLPISTAMESRVAQLDEASKQLFAPLRNGTQNSNQLNSTLGVFENDNHNENDAFRRNSSTSSDKPPALKKARSFKDFSHIGVDAKEDRLLQKGNMAPSVKNNSGDLGGNYNQQPGVFLPNSRSLLEPCNSVEGTKFPETGSEKDENLLKAGGMESVCEPKWSHINKLLSENGFTPVKWQLITSTTEISDKFFHILNDVVRDYKRREKEVQDLLAEREALRHEEKRSNEIMQKLEYEAELLNRKLATSEQREEVANAAAEKSYALLRKDNQRLEASHARMLQRCSQLEHGSRAKERALRKLQEKMQEAVQREERQRQKENALYEKLKHKIALGQKSQGEVIESNFLLRDLKPATIVGIYERQRARAQVEMDSLREENSRLCQELCEKENSVLSKMQENQSGFDKREYKIFQQLTQIDNILKTKTSSSRKMAPGEDTDLLPLIDATQDGKSHRALQENSRKQLDLNSSSALLAQNSDQCTSFKCQEFLQGICNLLKVVEPARITGAIDGLLKVVAAVPRMETFIEQVCDIVFNDGAMMLPRDKTSDLEDTPESVPGLLKSWLAKLQRVEELQEFQDSVSTQLWERFDEKAILHPMSARVAAASVKDLIETERQYLLSQASYREGEIILEAEPQKLPHCIIKHFQMLFEIPKLEGVMAVMNSVYIQISEYHNFARALCSMLGLPKDARPNSIISTMTSLLNKR